MTAARPPPPPTIPTHLLAATDLSPAGSLALERAFQLAAQWDARLTVTHVLPQSLWEDVSQRLTGLPSLDVDSARSAATEMLQAQLAPLSARYGRHADLLIDIGRPGTVLPLLAAGAPAVERPPADLLVVGAQGGHARHRLVLGTTAQKLLRRSPCPVLVVRGATTRPYASVLAPTDFSDAAGRALQWVAHCLPGTALHLAHAYELPYDGMMRFANVDASARRHYQREADARLHRTLLAWSDEAALPAGRRVLHLEHGDPASWIERWVEQLGVDLVAMAPHGKSGIEVAFLGSVSLHTALVAACDVLLVRGAGD